jgi:hypothetical protein
MDAVTVRRLREMDFHLALKSDDGSGREMWSRDIEYGNVKSIVCVRDSEAGFEYRFGLLGREEEGAETWGFDGADAWNALGCMLETWWALRAARRCLEGGIVRRSMRELLKKVV